MFVLQGKMEPVKGNAEAETVESQEDLVYMCAQCDIVMSSWTEMEQHALACNGTKTDGGGMAIEVMEAEGATLVVEEDIVFS
jgi:hypothetical protein